MKIGFDTQRLFLNSNGLNNYANLLLNSFLKYFGEHEYYTYTPRLTNQLTRFKQGDKLDYFHGNTKLNPVEASHLDIERLLKCNELNVFHALNSELPYAAYHLKAKKIVSMHNYHFLQQPDRFVFKNKTAYQRKIQKSCEISDAILVLNQKAKMCLQEEWKLKDKNIVVIPQSCDELYFDCEKNADQSIFNRYNIPGSFLLFIGDISVHGNLIQVLELVKHLNIALVVIGNSHSAYMTTVNKFIASNNLARKVFFPAGVTANQRAALYSKALCLIHPADFDEPGSPVVEAMASGCPVITGNDESFLEACGGSAAYLDVKDRESYFECIPEVINNVEYRKQMIALGRSYVAEKQGFNWIQKIMETYMV